MIMLNKLILTWYFQHNISEHYFSIVLINIIDCRRVLYSKYL